MTQKQKDNWRFWIPIAIAIIFPSVAQVFGAGEKTQRLKTVESKVERVTTRVDAMDKDTTDRLGRIETKMDIMLSTWGVHPPLKQP